jgi:hypothetical protein
MEYDLAKQLKDAEFPQTGKGHTIHDWVTPTDDGHGLHYYAPTLEELEAKWIAHTSRQTNLNYFSTFEGRGLTPTEAVANLYLALHKVQ